MSWLGQEFFGNTVLAWSAALGIAFVAMLLFYYARILVAMRVQRYVERHSDSRLGQLLIEVLPKTYFLLILILSLYIGLQYVDMPSRWSRFIERAAALTLLLQMALWGNAAIKWWLRGAHTAATSRNAASTTTVAILGFIARAALWSVVLLMMLDNVGVDITAMVASLGIGGIAVALAVQNILGDIFASLSIALDKPFVVGDFIIAGADMGTVEYIGIKTTRVRSISGEQIVFSNADLLKSRIHNYKRMAERRVLFSFGVVYETDADTVEEIPIVVRRIIEAQPHTRFDRAHFKSYGNSSLDFEAVYFVESADYNVYMDIQQAINVAMLRQFKSRNIEFAYPTRALYIHRVAAAATGRKETQS